ncbi:MAG TPA: PEGA domain-containing protein, partial [Vicinamibacterales bacterium]|nr:PEGA domain-containing protein [Vicinamibacterales bacterium]
WRRAAVVLLLLAGLAGGAFAGRRYLSGALAPAPGTLVVQSKPSGLAVFVDGRPFGPTPARIELAPGPHILELRGGDTPRVLPITVAPGATISHYVELASASRPASGQLDVRSEPAGARVFVDGQEAGVAPLLLANLSPGEHVVELQRDGATVRHVVTIEAGATSTLVAPVVAAPAGPASGWIAIRAPIAVQIYESGRLVGSSESERIMVPAGRRELEIVNTTLGFRTTRTVTVAPGATAVVSLALPNGVVHLNAIPWAEVWVDGRRVGETPIGNLSLPIGPHEIVFRHPVHGERRHAVSVTLAAPVRLSVDFTRP